MDTNTAIGLNPLLEHFNTLHDSAPFTKIKNEHYLPAFQKAMELAKAEIQAVIDNPAEPTFENTVEAMERTGERLSIIRGIFFNLNSAETNDEMQKIAQDVAPMLSEFGNDISLNEDLFARVKSVYTKKDELNLNIEQQTLLDNSYLSFVRNGANLSAEDKDTYRKITGELSKLGLQFQQNVLAETNAYEMHLTDEADLAGLPEFVREAAALTAKQKEKEGWVFTLQHPSFIPFMKYSDRRDLREKLFRASSCKGNQDNEFDNKEIIKKILDLKLEKARLLGFESHAQFKLERRMAETPERVATFLDELHQASKSFADEDLAEVQKFANENGFEGTIQRWDWTYYSEKLKNARYGFNEEEVKPFLKLENVSQGIFGLAKQLYNLEFKQNTQIEVYHPDVQPYEVYNDKGEFIAVFYMDFFPRDGKRSGAWMTDYRSQYVEDGVNKRPHISIVCNFTKPTETKPSLLTFDELTTFLHEFGHALHGMLSQCQYASTSGTNVFWDFVELPSQMHENWAYEKEWLDQFAVHYETGEKLPEELIHKIIEAKNFQSGYFQERQLSFGMLDMAYYTLTEPLKESVPEFEAKAMKPTQLLEPVEGSLMSTAFSHIFAGGYDAGYYSYKWAEVLDADAYSVFQKNGIFDKATADSFRENILERGGSEHPMILYKRFRGQEPTVDALLERSGLTK
ncbi:M3 family metallopeptidase [Mangrovibacterium diazotrophicum]|uniref:oligopeptidase A n=1 Tax=Mangrovibacterium diazotrophicum TaxID=1261403 RepID=A0A419W9R4_9BACT|nr:M3 family metallopeptidase [Mangrovibacterium diazotrophicum]RKD92152.1 peptidyl-dipeptidase Dcp [Mangrovibacterium diazotrophicum]